MMKERKNSEDLFRAVAKKHGVSAEEVRKDIEEIIADARNNPNPAMQAEFKKRFGDGVPTPEEFIYVLTREVKTCSSRD